MDLLDAAQQSAIGEWVRESDYGYYTTLSFHAVGMAIVVGVVFMGSLRVLGYAKDMPLRRIESLFTLAWVGFVVNALSGVGLFMANGRNLLGDVPFILKLAMIALGGILQWMMWKTVKSEQDVSADVYVASSGKARTLAVLNMACWTLAIMSGRIIAYTIDY